MMTSRLELTAGIPSTIKCVAEPAIMRRRSPASSSFTRSVLRLISVSDIEGHLIHNHHVLPNSQCTLLPIGLRPHHAVPDITAEWPIGKCQFHDFLIGNSGGVALEGLCIHVDRYVRLGRSAVEVLILMKVHFLVVSAYQLIFPIAFNLFVQLQLGADVCQLIQRCTGRRAE